MSNDTQRILEMLSEGKITVEEAERLLETLGANEPTRQQVLDPPPEAENSESDDGEQKEKDERDREEPFGSASGVRMAGCVCQSRREVSARQRDRHGGQYW